MTQRTFLVSLEYCGKSYAGWQIQPNALTVQQVLQNALFTVTRQNTVIKAAGRTDAGVHAGEQLAVFCLNTGIHPNRLQRSLNALTPADISVTRLIETENTFDLRREITGKTYLYRIHAGTFPPALEKDTWLHISRWLPVVSMESVFPLLIGTRDFSAFRAADCGSPNTVKTLDNITLTVTDLYGAKRLLIRFRGSGFLKHMVRILVGSLLDYSFGKISKHAFDNALSPGGRREMLGMTAPAKGLLLEQVHTRLPFTDYEKKNV